MINTVFPQRLLNYRSTLYFNRNTFILQSLNAQRQALRVSFPQSCPPHNAAPQMCAADAEVAEERSSAINASELSDWDWWVEQWQLTVEGGAAAEEREP